MGVLSCFLFFVVSLGCASGVENHVGAMTFCEPIGGVWLLVVKGFPLMCRERDTDFRGKC
jgi:hypothetical protein